MFERNNKFNNNNISRILIGDLQAVCVYEKNIGNSLVLKVTLVVSQLAKANIAQSLRLSYSLLSHNSQPPALAAISAVCQPPQTTARPHKIFKDQHDCSADLSARWFMLLLYTLQMMLAC